MVTEKPMTETMPPSELYDDSPGGGAKTVEAIIDVYNNSLCTGGICGAITANGNSSSTHCGTFGVVEKWELKIQQPK